MYLNTVQELEKCGSNINTQNLDNIVGVVNTKINIERENIKRIILSRCLKSVNL
jgi:hypothetical protein